MAGSDAQKRCRVSLFSNLLPLSRAIDVRGRNAAIGMEHERATAAGAISSYPAQYDNLFKRMWMVGSFVRVWMPAAIPITGNVPVLRDCAAPQSWHRQSGIDGGDNDGTKTAYAKYRLARALRGASRRSINVPAAGASGVVSGDEDRRA